MLDQPTISASRRPRPRGRRRWYLLFAAIVVVLLAAGVVTLRAATSPRSPLKVLGPTDPSVPVQAVLVPDPS